jgi:DeoR/GlpR family transcriptional regulator of sugar metabolism
MAISKLEAEERRSKVLTLIKAHPGIRTREIVALTQLAQYSVHSVLKDLLRQGEVAKVGHSWRATDADPKKSATAPLSTVTVTLPLSALSDPDFLSVVRRYDADRSG